TAERMSRTPDERLYSSGDNSSFAFTQCYVSFGDPDGEDFAFAKCAADGSFTLSGLPDGDWRLTVFDQWNDMLVDGLSTPVRLGSATNANCGSDSSRYKNTGTHVVYDAGGPADGSPSCGASGTLPCKSSNIAAMMANTAERVSLPVAQRVPGSVYCANADCTGKSILSGPGSSDAPSNCTTSPTTGATSCSALLSTGRIDPPWVLSEGWQGFSGQNSFIEFGKKPFAAGENGGIRGEVIYASTRPFDDPQMLLHTSWTPDVPGVTINLYKVGTAADR